MTSFRPLGAALADFAAELLDALYPLRCRICGSPAPDGLACGEHALPAGPPAPRCGRCAARLAPMLPDGVVCSACRLRPPGFRRVVTLADYRAQPRIRPWLFALKYGGRRDLAGPLGEALARRWSNALQDGPDRRPSPGPALFVPVPLHPLRRFERGYDQARLLARVAGLRAEVEVRSLLRRRRVTATQGSPTALSRAANVRGAFAPARSLRGRPPDLAGRTVWLVDDVLTSGATAEACALELRRLGARRIGVLTLARAGPARGERSS